MDQAMIVQFAIGYLAVALAAVLLLLPIIVSLLLLLLLAGVVQLVSLIVYKVTIGLFRAVASPEEASHPSGKHLGHPQP